MGEPGTRGAGSAVVDLSRAFLDLGGEEQILAVAQLVLTATAVPGVSRRADGAKDGADQNRLGQDGIPAGLRRFIQRPFVSGPHVEILLFLWTPRDRVWTASEGSWELRIDADQAGQILTRCVRSGLVRHLDDRYRYSPRTPAIGAQVDALAQLYPPTASPSSPSSTPSPGHRIRDFSDAFKFRNGN